VGVRNREVANREVADLVSVGLRWGGGSGAQGGMSGKPSDGGKGGKPGDGVMGGNPGDGGKGGKPSDGGKGGRTGDAGGWPYGACGLPGGAAVTAGGAGDFLCSDVRQEKGFALKYQHCRQGLDGG